MLEPTAEGFAIITSSTADESSQESDRLRASFFSHHLVNGLRGAADANGDHIVSLDEVYTYTYAETLRSSGRTMALQHPTYRVDLKGKGDVVLTRLVARERAALPLDADAAADQIVGEPAAALGDLGVGQAAVAEDDALAVGGHRRGDRLEDLGKAEIHGG